MASVSPPEKGDQSKRAILKVDLPCCADADRVTAPRGEYEISEIRKDGVCAVGLCSCATRNRFTLSFDSFLQHLNEGRIAVTGGAKL